MRTSNSGLNNKNILPPQPQFNQQIKQQPHNQQPKQMNIIYYSTICELCKTLLKLLNGYDALKHFHLQCVDNMDPIPQGLSRVPTLILAGVNKPFVGRETINWFENNKMMFINMNSERQKKMILYNIKKNTQKEKESNENGFSEMEHKGISDNFAYYCENIEKDIDMPQPKEFSDCQNDSTVIFTPPMDKKIGQDTQHKNIYKIQETRKNQEIEICSTMKQLHVEAIMKNEHAKLINLKLGINK